MEASPRPEPGRGAKGAGRWPGFVFGGIGIIMLAAGCGLVVQRLVILQTWPETEAIVVASQVETAGSQYIARIRVVIERPDGPVESEPASDYRSSRHGWIAATVERHPVGGTIVVRRHPRDPRRTRLDAGWNFNTFGLPLLLAGAGAVFAGVGALADRSERLQRQGDRARTREESRRIDRAQYLGVAAFIGLIGLAMSVAALALARPAWEQRGWPVIIAQVERSDIFQRSSGVTHKGRTPATFHVGRLYLAYEIAGRPYETALLLRGSSQDKAKIERRLAAIPPGTSWPIRVDPGDPHNTAAADAWPLVLPAVFLVVGLVLLGVTGLIVRSAPVAGRP